MFEDSTFESTGSIHTRSRNWMIATFCFNSSILLALAMIPLIYPQALPSMARALLMETPLVPQPEPKPLVHPVQVMPASTDLRNGRIQAPSVIPHGVRIFTEPEPAGSNPNLADWAAGNSMGKSGDIFRGQPHVSVVHPAATGKPMRIAGTIVEGLLLLKTIPSYPPIAKATGTQGTVVLAAIISRRGTIENLHVVNGPILLQQAALDAVRTWRYRPYLLDGQPVEVETTINVVFKLQ